MLPSCVLMNIMRFMNWEDLQRVQDTTRTIRDIVKRDFANFPLRLCNDDVSIKVQNDTLVIARRRLDEESLYFVPDLQQWQCRDFSNSFYAVQEMKPFLPHYMRFRQIEIFIHADSPLTEEHVRALESISYLWAEQRLYVFDRSDNNYSLLRMFESSALKPALLTMDINPSRITDFFKDRALCTVPVIQFVTPVSGEQIMEMVQMKNSCPESNTVVGVTVETVLDDIFDTIRQHFVESVNPCCLQVVIDHYKKEDVLPFQVENKRTKEVLHLKPIAEDYPQTCVDLSLLKLNFLCGQVLHLKRFSTLKS